MAKSVQVKPPIAEDAARIHALIASAKADKPKIETKKPAVVSHKDEQPIKPEYKALKIDIPRKIEPVDPRIAEQARLKNLHDAHKQPIATAKTKQVLTPVVRIDETKTKSAAKIINSRQVPDKPKAVLKNQPQIVRTAERIRPKIKITLPPAIKTVTVEVAAAHAEARVLTHGKNIIEPETYQKPPPELTNNKPGLGYALQSLFTDKTISEFEFARDREESENLDINETPVSSVSDTNWLEGTYNSEPVFDTDHENLEPSEKATTPLAMTVDDHTLHTSSIPTDEALPFLEHDWNNELSTDNEESTLDGAIIEPVYPTMSDLGIEDLPGEAQAMQEGEVPKGDLVFEQAVAPPTQVELGEFVLFAVMNVADETDDAEETSSAFVETEPPATYPEHVNLLDTEDTFTESFDDEIVELPIQHSLPAVPKIMGIPAALPPENLVMSTAQVMEPVDIPPPSEVKILQDKIVTSLESLNEEQIETVASIVAAVSESFNKLQVVPEEKTEGAQESNENLEQLCVQLVEYLELNFDKETFNLFVQYIAKPATLGLLAEALASAIELSKQGTHEHKLKPDPDSSATLLGDMTNMMQKLNPQQLLGRYVVLVAAA